MASTASIEMLESQLHQIELLRAMYSPEELKVEEETDKILEQCRVWCENPSGTAPAVPEEISLRLTLPVSECDAKEISMNISIPMNISSRVDSDLAASRVRPIQPSWLTRAETAQLSTNMPSSDLSSAIDHIRDQASLQLSALSTVCRPPASDPNGVPKPLVRVCLYFPSISTRQKRNDIVTIAPTYSLTGFLLAGKPGILCLEGGAQDIDDYMKYIKTGSWGDIPSQLKKVSERHRETQDVRRVFEGMEETTDKLDKRGERSNRGDMRALEAWLVERGLEGVVGRVLM
ncbi:RWD domain-containing protein 2A [Fulvia fulva]|uniref:RWD domain-containing protein 2A n=1 Tax=Passalora fulva TaxID=5499 RepID=A0A9Q8LF43_PASFU|nr:RWD domain-containing protein 2A [Fulvia fulva]KAK4628730.1 RWD domain-containing protein 2A [Fulvia fulva]KAK4630292.1 RWD domain-containing protein 2A [Fulvia fulva]UJO15533.1 RWD domain-containing protein 2A [Fulvia fulva]WPV12455.1 RWD domain-containing protein 2A [Fulvia fulva]WPV27604.1 RWD domain-containing protein 2A [Fulvia fulva]